MPRLDISGNANYYTPTRNSSGERAPTNIEMWEFTQNCREEELVAANVQTFIDNFEAFLGELKVWRQS